MGRALGLFQWAAPPGSCSPPACPTASHAKDNSNSLRASPVALSHRWCDGQPTPYPSNVSSVSRSAFASLKTPFWHSLLLRKHQFFRN